MELFCMEGIPYRLKAPFDFGFLSRYGRVFRIFDAQDSGNICFGVEQGGRRYFVKFAGALRPRPMTARPRRPSRA